MPSFDASPLIADRRSLLDTRQLKADDFSSIFATADRLAAMGQRFGNFYNPRESSENSKSLAERTPRLIACLFFEASTRTKLSFQAAAYRLGHRVLEMDAGSGSSMAKGETEYDTILNVMAMGPDLLVIRSNKSREVDELLPKLKVPVISAGTGTQAHPTQALLDAYTICRERGSLKGQRVLIVGDIRHSRVARSNFDVLSRLGAEIAVCGPESLIPEASEIPGIRVFANLDEAMAWPTVFMGLRIQFERHDSAELKSAVDEYHMRFGLNRERLKKLSQDAIIMHPGPINHGVEFSMDVTKDPRSRVLAQVANGVLIRAALLARILGAGEGSAER